MAKKTDQPQRKAAVTILADALRQAQMDMEGMLLGMNTHDANLWRPCVKRITDALKKAKQ